MAIREFELFHGAVITKLVRSDSPVTLRMIETNPSEAWSTYIVNDAVSLLIKHSTTQRKLAREEGAVSWTFVLGEDQVRQLRPKPRAKQVALALVCAGKNVKEDPMHICLLQHEQVQELISNSSTTPLSLTVRYVPRKELRVFKDREELFLVPQSAVERWNVPGS